MTISVAPARNEYTSNAGQTIFNYTFKIFENTDLNVYVTPSGQVSNDADDLTIGYTVTGLGDEDGGTITLTIPANLNDLITIVSNIPTERTIDYQNNGDFRPDVVNADFDRVVSMVKKTEDTANRAVLLQQSQQGLKPLTLPVPIGGVFLKWNDLGTGLVNAVGEVPTNNNIKQSKSLDDGQLIVPLSLIDPATATVYISGQGTDRGYLEPGADKDYTTSGNNIILNSSFTYGSVLTATGFTFANAPGILSIFGRTDSIIEAEIGDYKASQITNVPSGAIVSTNTQGAIDELDARATASTDDINSLDTRTESLEAINSWDIPKVEDFTGVASEARQIDASLNTVDIALPVLAIGDSFIYHNLITSTFKVQILNPIQTIKGSGGDIAAGVNMELAPGNSVQMVAKTTAVLSIVGVLV